jgi:hypothetical protein
MRFYLPRGPQLYFQLTTLCRSLSADPLQSILFNVGFRLLSELGFDRDAFEDVGRDESIEGIFWESEGVGKLAEEEHDGDNVGGDVTSLGAEHGSLRERLVNGTSNELAEVAQELDGRGGVQLSQERGEANDEGVPVDGVLCLASHERAIVGIPSESGDAVDEGERDKKREHWLRLAGEVDFRDGVDDARGLEQTNELREEKVFWRRVRSRVWGVVVAVDVVEDCRVERRERRVKEV